MTTVQPEAPAVPASTRPRTWLRRITTGGQIVESCPRWCTCDHHGDDFGALDDLQHVATFDGPGLAVFDEAEGASEWPLLGGRLVIDPYSEDERRRVPHVTLDVFKDEVASGLTPDELADIIAKVRAQCDQLEAVKEQLVAARAEYGIAGGAR